MIEKELLEMLVCPVSKEQLILNNEKNELICMDCHLAYPIIDKIPVLIKSQARYLEPNEY